MPTASRLATARGERQIVRILAEPAAVHGETAYRVRVSELPDPSVKANGVQVLVQFSIPVFVRGSGDNVAVAWNVAARGGALEVTAQNNGDRALKLAGLTFSSPGDAPIAIAPSRVAYIRPGASHVWSIAAPPALPVRAHIAATEERSGKPLAADVVIVR
jgi:fimbrial chaperone protein